MDELAKSTSLYGGLGAATTLIFFIYLLGILVVSSPVVNSSLHEEPLLKREQAEGEARARRGLHPHETGGLKR